MLRRSLLVGVGVASTLVVATSMASPSDPRGRSTASSTIATATTSDFRVVLAARQTDTGGGASSAVVRVITSQRVGGRWQQTATHRLRGAYFWNTAIGRRALCRLEIRTAGIQPKFRPYVLVQLLVSPALGCGTAQRFHLAMGPS